MLFNVWKGVGSPHSGSGVCMTPHTMISLKKANCFALEQNILFIKWFSPFKAFDVLYLTSHSVRKHCDFHFVKMEELERLDHVHTMPGIRWDLRVCFLAPLFSNIGVIPRCLEWQGNSDNHLILFSFSNFGHQIVFFSPRSCLPIQSHGLLWTFYCSQIIFILW